MDTSYMHSLKHRMQSRLEQAKLRTEQLHEDKENALKLIQQLGGLFASLEESHQFKTEIDSLRIASNEVIDDLLDELEIIEKYDWPYIAEVQEKSTALILASYEEPLRLKAMHEKIICKLTNSFSRYTKSNGNQTVFPEEQQAEQTKDYSTPSLEAMKSAIEKFWLSYDEGDTPPTQKAVSNYIAEQLGKPIRDRFTDELARAIKPD